MKTAALVLMFLLGLAAAPALAQERPPAAPATPEKAAPDGLDGLEVSYDEFDDRTAIQFTSDCTPSADDGETDVKLFATLSFPGKVTRGRADDDLSIGLFVAGPGQRAAASRLQVIAGSQRLDLGRGTAESGRSYSGGTSSRSAVWPLRQPELGELTRGEAFRARWAGVEFACGANVSLLLRRMAERMEQPGVKRPAPKTPPASGGVRL